MDKRRLRDLELFQSTLPLRGATWDVPRYILSEDISIHAPLTGSDSHAFRLTSSSRNFNPRSPYGERLQGHENLPQIAEFQSTLPLRGATRIPGFCVQPRNISIHAPLTGSDGAILQDHRVALISIHAPLTGSDTLTEVHGRLQT